MSVTRRYFPIVGVVITLQRWRGAAENDHAFFDLRAHDCDIARVIPRRFLLFVGGFVFFIDNDQSEIFRGAKTALRAPITIRARPE